MSRFINAFIQRRRLMVAPFAALGADAALTLLLQSDYYWSGYYEAASEGEVIGATALRLHPLAFVAWILIWASIVALLIALTPRSIARTTSVAATLLHTFALLTWVMTRSSSPYLVYFCGLVCAALIVYSLEHKSDKYPVTSS